MAAGITPLTAVERPLLKDLVYRRLLEAISDGTLHPGERLRDRELEAWLGVSRTPIRQALDKLQEVGLVDVEANRYTRVAPGSPGLIVDQLEIAVTLWQLGGSLTLAQVDDPVLADLARGLRVAADTVDEVVAGDRGRGTATTAVLDALRSLSTYNDNSVLARVLAQVEIGFSYQLRLSSRSIDAAAAASALRQVERAVLARDVETVVASLERFLEIGESLVLHPADGGR